MSKKRVLINGTIFNTVSSLYIAALNFIIIPIIIKNLGVIEYGLIGVINLFSMVGYISFFDLGISNALPKYIAEYKSQNKISNLNELINTSLLFLMIIGIFLAILIIPLTKILTSSVFNISSNYLNSFSHILIILVISYIFQFPLKGLKSILQGFLRFDLLNILLVISESIRFIGIFYFIKIGYQFQIIIYFNIISALFLTVSCYISIFYIFPHFNPFVFSFNSIKKIRKMSSLFLVGNLSSLLYNNTDRVLIGIFLTPTVMASYDVLSKLPMVINKFFGLAVSTLIPVTSSIKKNDEKALIKEIYHRGFRMYFAFIGPIILACMFFTKNFLTLWVGKEFIYLNHLLELMLIWCLLTSLMFGGNILMGIYSGVEKLTIYRMIMGILKIAFGFLLIKEIKLAAVPYSFIFAVLIVLAFLLSLYKKVININYSILFRDVFTILISGIGPFVLYYFIIKSDANNFIQFVGYIVFWCLVQWSLIYLITFDKKDRLTILQLVKFKH